MYASIIKFICLRASQSLTWITFISIAILVLSSLTCPNEYCVFALSVLIQVLDTTHFALS